MKVTTIPILTRYTYNPDLVPIHGTPLYDNKQAKPVPPTATVRLGAQYLTPKQVVHILHHPDAQPTPTNLNPRITLPKYILNIDQNPDNILIENLRPATTSRRWVRNYVVSDFGTLIPRHLLAVMGPEDLARFGVPPDEPTDVTCENVQEHTKT